jgi:hypothetical protein
MSEPVTPATFELFHAISDESSARVRRYVVERALGDAVRFRNVSYAEVQADLTARGGSLPPALWDGQRLAQGTDAIIARLEAHLEGGHAGD